MTSPPPKNRRSVLRPDQGRGTDVLSPHDSPAPGPATTTVRPRPNGAGGGRGRALATASRALRLVASAAVVLAVSIGVAYGTRRYLRTSPRFGIRTVLVEGVRSQVSRGG